MRLRLLAARKSRNLYQITVLLSLDGQRNFCLLQNLSSIFLIIRNKKMLHYYWGIGLKTTKMRVSCCVADSKSYFGDNFSLHSLDDHESERSKNVSRLFAYLTPENDGPESILHPAIEPVRPRSATVKMAGTNRFGPNAYQPGMDSPGPLHYNVTGPFEKSMRNRGRSSQYSTFGASSRIVPIQKEPGSALSPIDPSAGYNLIMKRTPSALILGRLEGYYDDGVPGPGHYQVRRDPTDTKAAIIMHPESPKPELYESTPGYYNISQPLVKKSFSTACFGVKTMCEHSGTHNYCCKNCCILCRNRSPVKLHVQDNADNRKRFSGGRDNSTASSQKQRNNSMPTRQSTSNLDMKQNGNGTGMRNRPGSPDMDSFRPSTAPGKGQKTSFK
eukprot:gene6747-13673_t